MRGVIAIVVWLSALLLVAGEIGIPLQPLLAGAGLAGIVLGALDADLVAAKDLIHRVATDLTTDPLWGTDSIGPPEIWGVQELGPHGVKIRVVIPTKPLRNWDLTRQLRERLKLAFDEAGIRMPSQLVDVGGMHSGYALLTKDLPFAEPSRDTRRRPHLDSDAPSSLATGPVGTDDGPGEARDATSELRMKRGPQVRPD